MCRVLMLGVLSLSPGSAAVAVVTAAASPAYASTEGLPPGDKCAGELGVYELAKKRTMLSAPADGATVVVGSPVAFSAESGLNWPLTFEVASSPALLPSPDIDGGPGSVAPGTAIYTFVSTKVTANPRTVYWAASFTRALNGCTGPPVTYTTPARALIVVPATTAPTLTPVSLTVLGQPSVGAKGANFTVICQAPSGTSCTGEGALEIAVRARGKHPSIVRLNLGRTTFAVGASQSETLLVAINRTARRLLARSHALRTTLTVKLTNGTSGAPTVVATGTLLIVTLNTMRIAQSIERAIASQRHIRAKVSCPKLVIQKQGNNFKCIARTYPGKDVRDETPFDVTQQNDKGYVTFVGE